MRARAQSASLVLALSALAALPVSAPAQDYPSRAVTIVAPAAPGGLYSLFARLIGSKLEQRLGKPVIVENRPGASSIVGATSVIRGPHDGYTLMVGNTSGLATNPSLHKTLPYDPVKDFAPIALIARIPEVLVVNAALPVQSLPDLAKLASPVAHLDSNDPPLLLIHGDADPQMPPQQSQEFAKAYEAMKLPVKLIVLPGSKHGGKEFYDEERTAIIAKFLDKALR